MTESFAPETLGNNDAEQSLHRCECWMYEVEIESADGDVNKIKYRTTMGTAECRQLTKRTFAPGHDAKLKSLLIFAGAGGHSVRRNEGGAVRISDPMSFAEYYGFAHQVAAGIVRAGQKLAEKADKKAQREAAKSLKSTKKALKRATTKYPVTIKVGRWEYKATIDETSNEATFTSANGQVKTAPAGKYTIVTK